MLNTENTKKIIELLQKLEPQATQEELESKARNLYDLGLLLVQLKIKERARLLQSKNNSP